MFLSSSLKRTCQIKIVSEIRFLCVSDEEISVRHSLELMRRACEDCNGALILEAARADGDIVSARKAMPGIH